MMTNGIMVSNVFTTLKIIAASPVKVLSTESRANKTKEEAPCSKESQKKTVKKAKIITAIIRSLTTASYLDILLITMNKKATSASNTIRY